jgi:hypothetical protein
MYVTPCITIPVTVTDNLRNAEQLIYFRSSELVFQESCRSAKVIKPTCILHRSYMYSNENTRGTNPCTLLDHLLVQLESCVLQARSRIKKC